jgi:hypothetical protein
MGTNLPPFQQLFHLFWPAAMAAQSIHVAAKLGIADLLKTRQSVDELATAIGAPQARRDALRGNNADPRSESASTNASRLSSFAPAGE